MTEIARIVASAVRDPFAVIRELGGDPALILSAASIDAALLAGATATLPLSAFVALIQQGSAQLRVPHFGSLVGRRFDLTNLGDVGQAALRAPTLGGGLRLIERAFAAVQGESELRLDVSGDRAVLSYRILDARIWPRDQDAELTLGVFMSLIASAAGPGWRPFSVAFEHPPNGSDRGQHPAPRGPTSYLAPTNAFAFDASLLDLPMPMANAPAFRPMATALRAVAHRLECHGSVEARVRRAVLRDLGRGRVNQTDVAAALGMSRRTLRRKLDEEGTGFAQIVAACRAENARGLLGRTTLAIPVIAERLGYSDTTAFERAFARQTGLTPARYRRHVCGAE